MAHLLVRDSQGAEVQRLLLQWVKQLGDALEVHLVGHSAGAIILGHFLTALAARRVSEKVKTVHLYAPA